MHLSETVQQISMTIHCHWTLHYIHLTWSAGVNRCARFCIWLWCMWNQNLLIHSCKFLEAMMNGKAAYWCMCVHLYCLHLSVYSPAISAHHSRNRPCQFHLHSYLLLYLCVLSTLNSYTVCPSLYLRYVGLVWGMLLPAACTFRQCRSPRDALWYFAYVSNGQKRENVC